MLYTYGTRPMSWYDAPPCTDDEADEIAEFDRQELGELDDVRWQLQCILDEYPRIVGDHRETAEDVRARLNQILETLIETTKDY